MIDEKELLKFIPFKVALPVETIKANYEYSTGKQISIDELDSTITKLMSKGLIFEEEPLKYKRVPIQIKEEKKEEIKEVKTETQIKPLYHTYWPLGEGQGISVTLWSNNLQLQRRERDENGNWKTTQEINLARQILEKLFIRLPIFFKKMKDEEKE